MFEFVLAICLAYDITGDPVNPCMMVANEKKYDTLAQCKSEARKMEIEYVEFLSEKYPNAAIIQNAPCGRIQGQGY